MARDYQVTAVGNLDRLIGIRGRRVLEIGGDIGLETANLILDRGAAHVTSINYDPNFPDGVINDRLTARNHDGTKLSECFANGSFDVVFGVALLEHVHDVPLLVQQVHDVLSPTGSAFLNGFPIWTSDIGHHVYVRGKQRHFRFHVPEDNPIPPWHHLLWTRDEMESYLASTPGFDTEDANAIAEFVYTHPILSRRGHAHIMAAFRDTPFAMVNSHEFLGSPPDEDVRRKLAATRWGRENHRFDVRGVRFILRKGTPRRTAVSQR